MSAIKILTNMNLECANPLSETEAARKSIHGVSLQSSFPFEGSDTVRFTIPNVPIMCAGSTDANGETSEVQNMYSSIIRKFDIQK